MTSTQDVDARIAKRVYKSWAQLIKRVGTVKLTLREQAGAAAVTSPFESLGAGDGVPSEERATP